jgi:5-methylthioadenosine/S-adenosylhomocysteine deaminase
MKRITTAVALAVLVFSSFSVELRAQTRANKSAAPRKQPVNLIVSGGTIVTMDADRRVLENGAIAVKGDTIAAIGLAAEVDASYTSARRIDARGKLVLPGLINGHTHAAMTLLRGLKDDVTLDEWLTKFIFPAEARNVNEEFVRWGTRLAALEMIRGGTTTFVDMYYFEDAVAQEAKSAGMRGVLGETVIDFPAPDNKTTAAMLSYTENFLRKWQGDSLIQAAIAPHSIYICSERTLRDAFALARKYHAHILIHVAETKKERDDSLAKNQLSPVAYLDRLGLLGPDVIAAHCIWVDESDRRILAEKQVGCVHNPSSNMMLSSGVAPVPEMRAQGVRVGLGTDGPAGSNNDLDMMEEMDLAAKLQKVSKMEPRALGAKDSLAMATIDGARALHMASEIGSLEAGKKADLIVLGLQAPRAVPLYDVYSQIVYALKASDVETVVIGGRIVLQGGKVLTLNEAEIIAKALEYGKKVQASLK